MEFGYIGIAIAIVLVLVGMKVMKWVMWGLAILIAVAAFWFF